MQTPKRVPTLAHTKCRPAVAGPGERCASVRTRLHCLGGAGTKTLGKSAGAPHPRGGGIQAYLLEGLAAIPLEHLIS